MRLIAIIVFVSVACPARAAGQTSTATLNAAFTSLARLSLSSASLTFADADPDTTPQVAATPGERPDHRSARAPRGGTVTLTVQASGDLRSGVTTIPASALTWTATGSGFVGGTVSSAAPQLVASWNGSGVRTGAQRYYFQNLWTHPTGTYSLTLLYTLSAA